MTIKASGQISASDISREFGQTTNISFNAYRISQTPTGSDLALPLDTDIPGPGQPIKFSDFYSKRLNIVVNCAPTNTIQTRVTARTQYNINNGVTIIGGFKAQLPSSTNGSKVWIHANGILGSDVSNTTSNGIATTRCSLIVGSWENDTTLIVDVGTAGTITGSGGAGGKGGSANLSGNDYKNSQDGFRGFNGTSALGIDYTNNSVVISNRGRIQEGAGGGGGGGASWNEKRRRNSSDGKFGFGGSGGGGGRGYPAGSGGVRGTGFSGSGNSGGSGNVTTSGNGGTGRSDARSAGGGGGGAGGGGLGGSGVASGGTGVNGTDNNGGAGGKSGAFGGDDGRVKNPDRVGGAGGLNGFAVVVNGDGSNISITGNSLIGNQINNTVPT